VSDKKRGKTAVTPPGGGGWVSYAAPFGLCVGSMPVALLAHMRWGHDPVMSALMAAAAIGLTAATHTTWHKRHEATRFQATLFAALVLGWTVLAAASDPLSPGMLNAWLIGTFVLPVLWLIRRHGLAAPHEADVAGSRKDPLFDRVKAMRGSRSVSIEETTSQVAAEIKLPRGKRTVEDVRAAKTHIAQMAGVGDEDVTVASVPGRADMVKVAFTRADVQKERRAWTGPSAPGKSIRDAPLVPGVRANGKPLEVWIVGDDRLENPRQLPHTLCTGVNGSGKTETVKTLIVDMRWRTDVVPVVGDPAKFGQSFGEIADALAIAADGPQQVRQLIRNLPEAVKYRAQLLGSLTRRDGTIGYSQWEPECYTEHGIPLVFLDIEEAADALSGGDDTFDEAIRKCRSVGISLCASLQTAIHTNIERKTRGQFTNSLTHGCVEDYDAKFSLSAATRQAGADPTKWRNDFAGSLYGELSGTPQEEWSVDARSFYLTREQRRAELDASRAAGYWAVMDPGTAMVLGKGIKVPDARISNMLPGVAADPEPEEDAESGPPSALRETEYGVVDVNAELPPVRRIADPPVPDRGERMSTADARAALEDRITEMGGEGHEEVSASDLKDWVAVTGRGRTWLYPELDRLVDEGVLEAGDGRNPYRILPRVLASSGPR